MGDIVQFFAAKDEADVVTVDEILTNLQERNENGEITDITALVIDNEGRIGFAATEKTISDLTLVAAVLNNIVASELRGDEVELVEDDDPTPPPKGYA